jgi:iron complex transport system ATP-binding protein
MKAIEAINLKVGYNANSHRARQIGPEISFNALEGELVALIGRNGSGKSTLLRTLTKLQPPLSGKVIIGSKELHTLPVEDIAKLVSFVSTEVLRVQNFSVFELVALGRFPYTNWLGRLDISDKQKSNEAIEMVGLTHLSDKNIMEISDGERQRAMIARAIAQDTSIIILDEPTAYLDLLNKYEIVHLLSDLAHIHHKTIIFSTHDLNITLSEADKVLIIDEDHTAFDSPDNLINQGQFDKLFGDKLFFDRLTGTFKKK